jgi:hypothetical protein
MTGLHLHAPIYMVHDQSNTAIHQKQTNVDEFLVTEPLASPTYVDSRYFAWPFTLLFNVVRLHYETMHHSNTKNGQNKRTWKAVFEIVFFCNYMMHYLRVRNLSRYCCSWCPWEFQFNLWDLRFSSRWMWRRVLLQIVIDTSIHGATSQKTGDSIFLTVG